MDVTDNLKKILESYGVFYCVVAGSHLYGINSDDSDRDFIAISDSIDKNVHIIIDDVDITIWSVNQFFQGAEKGAEQVAQLLYAPSGKIVFSSESAMLNHFLSTRVNMWNLRQNLLTDRNCRHSDKSHRESARRCISSILLCATGIPFFVLRKDYRDMIREMTHNPQLLKEVKGLASSTMIGENNIPELYRLVGRATVPKVAVSSPEQEGSLALQYP